MDGTVLARCSERAVDRRRGIAVDVDADLSTYVARHYTLQIVGALVEQRAIRNDAIELHGCIETTGEVAGRNRRTLRELRTVEESEEALDHVACPVRTFRVSPTPAPRRIRDAAIRSATPTTTAHQPISHVITSAPAPGVITRSIANTIDSTPAKPMSHA